MFSGSGAGNISLDWALQAQLLEFWFQPKIDLARRQICGLEMFARMRHPLHGTIAARPLLAGASAESLSKLSQRGVAAMRSAFEDLENLGARLPISINAPPRPADCLILAQEIFKKGRPEQAKRRTVILDITENSAIKDPDSVRELASLLETEDIKLAIDNFGEELRNMLQQRCSEQQGLERAKKSLETFCGIEIAEIKLHADLVRDCWKNDRKAAFCKLMIDLVRSLGSTPVAIGLESGADTKKLTELGCSIGQGHYLGKPMPLSDLIDLVRTRAR
jgi:diguanylate cyclase